MARRQDFRNFFIYRWRYILGYGLVGLILAGVLAFAGAFVPGGLSSAEQASVVRSESLTVGDISTFAVPHVPYHILQAGSLELFGATEFSIKLPSLVLGLLAAIGLVLLLRRWFKPNIAVLASLIAITTGQFLFIAQSGTPSIMYIFWPVALLLVGTQVTRSTRFRFLWKLLFAATVAGSLYTPLGIYPLLAILLTIALHPHLRNAARRLSKVRVLTAGAVATLIVTPLILAIMSQPTLGLTLLGVPSVWPPDLLANFTKQLEQYFLFWAPNATTLLTPVFGLGSMLLIFLGIRELIKTRATTHSYLIMCWVLILVPVLLMNPALTTIVFVPAVLLLAAGLTSLIRYWYRLFPLNPYARIAGLIPLIVLVAVLIGSGLDRYAYGYYYSPTISTNFSQDLDLIPNNAKQIVVADKEKAFYAALATYRTSLDIVEAPTDDKVLVTRAARESVGEDYVITNIITSTYKNNADRFYEYQKLTD